VAVYDHLRILPLIRATERVAAGEPGTTSGRRTGPAGRLARAVNGVARALTETHDAAMIDRLTGVNNRGPPAELFHRGRPGVRYDWPCRSRSSTSTT
jgi:hypothetical protein